jgi:hypothetical protein
MRKCLARRRDGDERRANTTGTNNEDTHSLNLLLLRTGPGDSRRARHRSENISPGQAAKTYSDGSGNHFDRNQYLRSFVVG